MEYVVFYNAGKNARLSGENREAPFEFDYPIRSRYHEDYVERITMTAFATEAWLHGFDGRYDRKRA